MFDKNLTESQLEVKNSSENKIKRAIPIVCAAICISLTGGYIYYQNQLDKMIENKPIENTYKEYIDNSEKDFQKFLENYNLSDEEKAELENYITKANKNVLEKTFEGTKQIISDTKVLVGNAVDDVINPQRTGTDRNGHPYLKKGEEYTFGANGLPNEAPSNGKQTIIISPINGHKLAYGGKTQTWYDKSEADIEREKAILIAERKMNARGDINPKSWNEVYTEEERANMKWKMGDTGALGY